MQNLIDEWFTKWREGDFLHLPVTDSFSHTSPFGTIDGKDAYLSLVAKNKDKFLGYQFVIHDQLVNETNACVRYTALQG